MAFPQTPLDSVMTNASKPAWLRKSPPALQFPSDAQETERIPSLKAAFSDPVSGTCLPGPQLPCTSLTTSPPLRLDWTSEPPPALQLPAEAHDTDPSEDAANLVVGPATR